MNRSLLEYQFIIGTKISLQIDTKVHKIILLTLKAYVLLISKFSVKFCRVTSLTITQWNLIPSVDKMEITL